VITPKPKTSAATELENLDVTVLFPVFWTPTDAPHQNADSIRPILQVDLDFLANSHCWEKNQLVLISSGKMPRFAAALIVVRPAFPDWR
jgi:hypothetical protein